MCVFQNGYTGRRAFNEEKFQLLLDRHAEAAETLRREREKRQHHMALLPPELIQYAAPDGKVRPLSLLCHAFNHFNLFTLSQYNNIK